MKAPPAAGQGGQETQVDLPPSLLVGPVDVSLEFSALDPPPTTPAGLDAAQVPAAQHSDDLYLAGGEFLSDLRDRQETAGVGVRRGLG